MRPLPLVLAALLVCAAPVAAQRAPAATPPTPARETAVVFTVQGRLGTAPDISALPVALVERLARDPALATITIGPPSGPADLVLARFVFPDEAAFRVWYARAETREAFRAMGEALLQTTYAFTLKRYPAAAVAEAAQGTP